MNARQSHSIKQEENEKHLGDFAFNLRIGSWKTSFLEYQYKTIIAEALNACVCQRKEDFRVQVKGYVITSSRLCLVIKIRKDQLERMFHFFYARVREEIRHALRQREHDDPYEKKEEFREINGHLFEKRVLYNDFVIRLMTGHEVVLEYYDPHLERLKVYLHRENFCSVADYHGIKGPVIVQVRDA